MYLLFWSVYSDSISVLNALHQFLILKKKMSKFWGIALIKLNLKEVQSITRSYKHLYLSRIIMGKVRILPETKLPPCPPSALLYTNYLHRNAIQSQRIANACQLQNHAGNSSQPRFLVGFNKKHIGVCYFG